MSLTIGEVHTGLLMTSVAVSVETATDLLAILPGGSVGIRRRPVRYCWSPEVLTGVDCLAPLAEHREVRVVGTPATKVSLTDGYILQASTHAAVRYDPTGRRRSWGHYLAQPGVIEVLGKGNRESLASGFLSGTSTARSLDIGAVNVRALAAVQRNPRLDHNPPFRSRPTQLRWSAETANAEQELTFTLGSAESRTVSLRSHETDPRRLADFCADLALHDWMLSALLDLVDRALARRRAAVEVIAMLRPGIDHLVHAWMPAAHVSKALVEVWQEFDHRSGFSLQWQKTVERIRDQLSAGIIEALQPLAEARNQEPV
jgi:hypothetical protein